MYLKVALGHINALEKNVGVWIEALLVRASNKEAPYEFKKAKTGDIATCFVDPIKAKKDLDGLLQG